ncbi:MULTISPECIES: transporter substrate-binding domain-containing protein [Marinobacter]|uniref:transporter substrate-binding domain-containing protein n=1 Tax=Marinobacter TaxID=2742 RepID=UPI000DADE014|nr:MULTISPECIES: transporter substrate-binding domain-containing protein [Marinobacter]
MRLKHQVLAITLVCLFGPAAALAQQTLQLFASAAPPYQYAIDGTVHGTTIEALRCALGETRWRPSIRMVPQRRAIHALQKGLIDGYLGISSSDTLDPVATLSAPLALEKWYLYALGDVALDDARLGAIAGSNEAHWIQDRGYNVTMQVASLNQLVALVNRGRIDALVVDQRIMDDWRDRHPEGTPLPRLTSRFIRFAPLGTYFNQAFLQANPNFLSRFNANLEDCVTAGFQLEADEARRIRDLAVRLFNQLHAEVDVISATYDRRSGQTLAAILQLDEQWRAAQPVGSSDLARDIEQRPLSRALQQWQEQQDGLVSEILVMDAQGALVAMSQLTSDYWQGDEDKFRRVAVEPGDQLYLGPVRYDASSNHFQVIVSRALHDPQSDDLLGAVALGIDIEWALTRDP